MSSGSGASSSSSSKKTMKLCEICVEKKEKAKNVEIKKCFHSFCCDCVINHVSAKIADGYSTISCLAFNCPSVMDFNTFCKILPTGIAEKWNELLCEAVYSVAEKVFCPFKDCSEVMVVERGMVVEGCCNCPFCLRQFCATCQVPWHHGITCNVYQMLVKEELDYIMMKLLASQMKWMRCPKCKTFVEKISGCLHITCRCKFEFCYSCGSTWSSTHGGCQPYY